MIYRNVIDSARTIVRTLHKLSLHPVLLQNCLHAGQIMNYAINMQDPVFQLSVDIARAVDSLWHDPIIPTLMDHSSQFYLIDMAP